MKYLLGLTLIFISLTGAQGQKRARDLGLEIGVMDPGRYNAITDVPGIAVGHQTVIEGDNVRTGVTAIIPHQDNVFQNKVPAGIFLGNGFGKLMGFSQVEELGNIETPIVLTNTLSVPTAASALIKYTLDMKGNEDVRSVNPVVGETNDGYLNDIRGQHIKESHVLAALEKAKSGEVAEGNVGAGTGTVCFGFKGGIGTSSRILPSDLGGYTVGVLVQTNFGGTLTIDGLQLYKALERYPFKSSIDDSDGSCMIVVATNAPIDSRNLKRFAKRAFLGLGRTGGIASNGSGDYIIAFSTDTSSRIPYRSTGELLNSQLLHNDQATPLFMAVIEATEEAIINALLAAETMTGFQGRTVAELPVKMLERMLNERQK